MKIVAIIPARLQSSRLENKIILDIAGKPMIQHVYHQVCKAEQLDGVYIATDSTKIQQVCQTFTDRVLMTSSRHSSGTERIVEAMGKIPCDGVVNVQGDEPMVDPVLIDNLATGLRKNEAQMLSAMHLFKHASDLFNPNNVKVTVDNQGYALYFSRSVIPYDRQQWEQLKANSKIPETTRFYKHIGLYAYSRQLLELFATWPAGVLEKSEKLEQLRVLEQGYRIKMVLTDYDSIGVDTQEDLDHVRRLLAHHEH